MKFAQQKGKRKKSADGERRVGKTTNRGIKAKCEKQKGRKQKDQPLVAQMG